MKKFVSILFLVLFCGVAFSGCEQGLGSDDGSSSDGDSMGFSFSDMYKKLSTMEERIKTLQDTVNTQTGSIGDYQDTVAQMQNTIDTQAVQITALETSKADASGVYTKAEMDGVLAPEAKTGITAYSLTPVLSGRYYLLAEIRDEKDEYNPSTGTFTAKEAGYYTATVSGGTSTDKFKGIGFRKNDETIAHSSLDYAGTGTFSCTVVEYLEVGDTLRVYNPALYSTCKHVRLGIRKI
ncbi:MAG: hypothetical protein GY754_34800 [bacterium]|nr:hypothetical protein [bacterium]